MKKSIKKKTPSYKKKAKTTTPGDIRLERAIIENFISLQKVLTNLSVKFDKLSDQIAKLLEVFEISAKALAEKDFEKYSTTENKEILDKLNALLDQNKTIAKGLTLMHETSSMPGETKPQPREPGFEHGGYRQSIGSSRFKPLPKY